MKNTTFVALWLLMSVPFETFAVDGPTNINLRQAKAFDVTPKKTFHATQNDVRLTVQVPDAPATARNFLMRVTISNLASERTSVAENGFVPCCRIELVTAKGERCPLTQTGRGYVGPEALTGGSAVFTRLDPSGSLSWTFPIKDFFTLNPDSYSLKVTLRHAGKCEGLSVDNAAFTIKAE